jgi:hypothetical protein
VVFLDSLIEKRLTPIRFGMYVATAKSPYRNVRVCERWWSPERRFDGQASLEVKADLQPPKRDHTDKKFATRHNRRERNETMSDALRQGRAH